MRGLKRRIAALWPVMRLRTIMFGLLLVVAALPGVAAIGLRVYENALVRRTEAELIAQGSALAAAATLGFPAGGSTMAAVAEPGNPDDYTIATTIDLRSSPVLPERPAAQPTRLTPDPAAQHMAAVLQPVLEQTLQATLAAIVLLDRQGIVLNGRDAGKSLADLPEVRAALGGHATTVLRRNGAYLHPYPLEWVSRATDLRLHHARPIIVSGQVVGVVLASRSPRALFRGMYEDRGKIAVGTAVIFLLLVMLTALLGRTIVRPIEALSRATRALAEGRKAEPPSPSLRVHEIDGLIRDFAVMAGAIEARSHYLRDFARALAHEFKTPLAGLAGGIDLLQDHGDGMTEAQRGQFLANMAGDTERLNRLISRLMELARADMERPGQEARCDVVDCLGLLADGLSANGFAIEIACDGEMPGAAIEPGALETVLTTLIDNARAAGATRVTISASAGERMIELTVGDDGCGIAPADQAKIFEPFFTSKRAQGGTGLGLPIARALIEGNGGTLTLLDAERGTRFRIIVPRH